MVLATIAVNQEMEPNDFRDETGTWENLGGPYDITGSTLIVELSDEANDFVIADAVRIERLLSSPDLEVLDGTMRLRDGSTLDFGVTAPNRPVDKQLTVQNVGQTAVALTPIDPASLPAGL